MNNLLCQAFVALTLLCVLWSTAFRGRSRAALLPGPRYLPLIGRLFDIWLVCDLLRFSPAALYKLVEKAGCSLQLNLGFKGNLILLSDTRCAVDVMTNDDAFDRGNAYAVFRDVTPGHLLGLEGDDAVRMRMELIRCFSKSRIARLQESTASETRELCERLRRRNPSSTLEKETYFEASQPLRGLFLNAIATVVLGAKIKDEAVVASLHFLMQEWHVRIMGFDLDRVFRRPKVSRAWNRVRSFLSSVVVARQNSPGDDLISELLTRSDLSMKDICDLAFTCLAMGHENSSCCASWALSFVAQSEEHLACIRKEFDGVQHGELGEKVAAAVYTKAVVSETMRLRPPVPMFSRQAKKHCVLTSASFPTSNQDRSPSSAGTASQLPSLHIRPFQDEPVELVVSPYILHRLPEHWGEDAERFDPQRWLPAHGDKPESSTSHGPTIARCLSFNLKSRGAFCPFGMGRRSCPAQGFAAQQVALFVGCFVGEWGRITPSPAHPPPIPKMEISIRSKDGIWLRLEPQEAAESENATVDPGQVQSEGCWPLERGMSELSSASTLFD